MSRNVDKCGGAKQKSEEDGAQHFAAITDSLTSIFGQVMEREALFTIVESCGGDQSRSADVIMDIIGQNQPETTASVLEEPQSSSNQATTSYHQQSSIQNKTNQQMQPVSYSNVSNAPGSFTNQKAMLHQNNVPAPVWPEDLKRIFSNHNQGYRTLIILRGLPGSGKTHLGKKIIEMTVGPGPEIYNDHVFSSDDFFYVNGKYMHVKQRLGEAHEWNKQRVYLNLINGRSPIIVDNTNVKFWEMQYYARAGVKEGYYIEILEPSTSWAWNVNQLRRKSKHNVPYETIKRMLDNFDPSISGQEYIRKLNLHYPPEKNPPVLRFDPPIAPVTDPTPVVSAEEPLHHIANPDALPSQISSASADGSNDNDTSCESEWVKLEKYAEVAKKLEEFEKIDSEWEKGEKWDDGVSSMDSKTADIKSLQKEVKPQRKSEKDGEKLFPNVDECQDWSNLIPPWQNHIPAATIIEPDPVETRSSSTCIEFGDTDHINPKHKVVTGTARDINFYYIPPMKEFHQARKFDKSTETGEESYLDFGVTYKKEHFQNFRKMFKKVARSDLWDIFQKCGGDANWAVEMVIDGVQQSQILTNNNSTDNEESDGETCEDIKMPSNVKEEESCTKMSEADSQVLPPKKIKKDKAISESSLMLKRQIEKNIVMPDKFYSNHTINLRKGIHPSKPINPEGESTSQETKSRCSSTERDSTRRLSESSSDSESNYEDDENVTFNLGREFVQNLDRLFERGEGNWDENIMPVVTMPKSILNKINAFWMESLTYQIESQATYSKLMLKQDEEFARQLAELEEEQARAGTEQPVPDFKEIMDMDLALTLYQKDVAQWKNELPNDWAAKMTADKLANLFPDIPRETLCELLMAYDNNFQNTVEALLMSTGQTSVLEKKNGVNKFIMDKELQRQARVIEAEKQKQLENAEWPVFTASENVNMQDIDSYRKIANVHFNLRNRNYDKAQQCFDRGWTEYAYHYSNVATFHKRMFDQSNNLAATALIHFNQAHNYNSHTLDLHHLFVSEAMQAMDMYLDHHISILQGQKSRRAPNKYEIYVITGRGLHSNNKPKIKPAAKKRLSQRGFRVTELNPGLLSVKLTRDSKLTYQLP